MTVISRVLMRQMEDVAAHIKATEPEINHGGCCFFAEAMVEALQRLGYEASGAVCSFSISRGATINKARQHVADPTSVYDWDRQGFNLDHIIVRVKTEEGVKFMDADGFGAELRAADYGFHMIRGQLTLEDLQLLSKSKEGWNESFPASHHKRVHAFVIRSMVQMKGG